MTQWQPIETAPKDGTEILLFDPDNSDDHNGGVAQGYFSMKDGGRNEWVSMVFKTCKPTHWMPLPSPPEQSDL